MLYCLNPSCYNPENPDNNKNCHGCGENLSKTSQKYLFQVHYKIIKKLGEGAFGRTYLAHDLHLMDEKRVIKKLVTSMQGGTLQKAKELFKREAKRLYELEHPQIPKLHGYFEDNNDFYLVQEFIEGHTLFDEVWQQGRFSEEKIKQLLKELLPVLDYLHQQKILHRDIKPENIMRRVSSNSYRQGNTAELVLIDFGASKQVSTTMKSMAGTQIYTMGYAAIEQMQGRAKPASDIYSLGVTAVRLLTQCFPDDEDEYGNTIDKLLDENHSDWRWKEYAQEQGILINPKLAAILDKMLAQNISDRYQTAAAVLNDLQKLDETQPSVSPIVTPQPTIKKPIAKTFVPPSLQIQTPQKKPDSLENYLQTVSFETVKVNARGQIINREIRQAQCFTEILPGGVKLEMMKIPGGKFMMGISEAEIKMLSKKININWLKECSPRHLVTLQPFFMSKYAITQEQWKAIASQTNLKVNDDLDPNPSDFKGNKNPVQQVSWYHCVEFCQRLFKLTQQDNIPRIYQLPSEAQWEYACRAGTTTPFYFGETITTDLANYNGSYVYAQENKGIRRGKTTPVGSFPPNGFGLYDMHGNVWEWCADNSHYNYQGAPNDGSAWMGFKPSNLAKNRQNNSYAVLRGGSWFSGPDMCSSAIRLVDHRRDQYSHVDGFRVVCVFDYNL
ncbi:bifunctional serine/threonine-protein kinase/formylglycine-generating enzyme family protein [Cyanothece sp. BG0011]|uniref:bifunctional serine/threonine-protein kinase/formylglycine-generating enzyme family protein n=1 Tax=Cyanothece sp. BG0011 TaxID=2082950 RepID=UPI000D1D7DF0|nr:bifunctional serine/threonine-protein kinase/formylglycine-generating enzyme family protein [Cyanothece sp. BG0011]